MRTVLWPVDFVFFFLVIVSTAISNAALAGRMPRDMVERAQASGNGDDVEETPACIKEQGWRRKMVSLLTCKDDASFYTWGTQVTKQEDRLVAVRVSQVNGSLTLPPNPNLSIVALFLQQTNLTHFTKHSQNLSTLEELILSDNPDFDASSLLHLGNLPSLVTLQLAGTTLAMLSNRKLRQVLKEMPALQYLDVSSSNLRHLDADTFKQNTKLQELNVAGNELINPTLDQGFIQQLMHLNISGCSMEQLQVESRPGEAIQTNLRIVDLSHNNLTSLQASFMNIISNSLAHLNISDNLWNKSCTHCSHYHLWNYASKHPDQVHGAQNLNCFRPEEALKVCGWEECPATCTCDPKSKTVNCSSTGLKTIPQIGPSDAEILLLENNTLLNMNGIESPVWCNLRIVSADHNRISSILPPDTVGHCTCFDHDDLHEEEENCLPQSLQKLSLSNNKIKKLSHNDCQLLYSLQELHLSGNKVEHLGSHVCSSLELLEVLFLNNNSYSDLEEQDVAPYPNLRKLNLSFNKLVTLPYRILELMPKLTVLDVSNNNLREFSGETSTPDTPFTSLVPTSLEELDLSNNNLELINSVLSLEHIPILRKLSIYNNPWECSCEIIRYLLARVLKDLKNTAMVNAVETLECQKPSSLRGLLMNDPKVFQICPTVEHQRGFFTVMVGILIIICLVVLVVHITCQKISPNFYDVLGLPPARSDVTFTRRYSVYIVHSWQDNEVVKTDLVDPLHNLDYSVAWNENVFLPGDNLDASIEKAVMNSRRMVVVASKNLLTYLNGKKIIKRGLCEERNVPGFKVVALVMDNLPLGLYDDLHEIVAKRTHVSRQNSNYIRAICDFLPVPVPSHPIITFTETNLYNFLQHQMEIILKRENQRANLQEVFPSQNLDLRGSSVGTSVTSQSENGVIMPTVTDGNQETMFSRFYEKRVQVPATEQPSTFCNLYTLEENKEGEEEVAQIEGFRRGKTARHSTRF